MLMLIATTAFLVGYVVGYRKAWSEMRSHVTKAFALAIAKLYSDRELEVQAKQRGVA